MISFKPFSTFARLKGATPTVGPDRRIYAVGDVHGRFDLFVRMLHAIGSDMATSAAAETKIIFLGDLIDRGPQSAKVLDLALQVKRHSSRIHFLKGNHEEVLLKVWEGETEAASFFYDIGGRETLMSYGLDPKAGDAMTNAEIAGWIENNIPLEHMEFMDEFEDMIPMEDYLFVHAGIRPHVPLDKQAVSDLRWIKREFINYEGQYPAVVVHGHSVFDNVDERRYRIGIDTGAYFTGRLTCLVLEGTGRRYLTATAEGWDPSEQEQEFSLMLENARPTIDD